MLSFTDESLTRLEHLLYCRPSELLETADLRRAAVVIPLVRRERGWSLIFLRRSESLRVHKGQVAFPGGGVEADEAPHDAAVREMEEEIGISRDSVRLIGRLDDLITRTGFVVTPFVGVVETTIPYVPAEEEVTDIFEVPIDALFGANNPEVRYLDYLGDRYPVYYFHHEGREIWGLTGRIVKGFLDIVRLSL